MSACMGCGVRIAENLEYCDLCLWWDDEGDCCATCGGGLGGPQLGPETRSECPACCYGRITGRSYERDVDTAQSVGLTFREYARPYLLGAA